MSETEKQNQKKQVSEIFSTTFPNEGPPVIVLGVDDDLEAPCDFEEAVAATGYGCFNNLLLLAVLPGGFASLFDTTTMSYILPPAECDLELTLLNKGVLNAITYTGMMSSAFLWGFLADTRGRRSLLMFGYLADFICNVFSSMSQGFYVLVIFRFLNGFIINGPFAINMTYLAEFHGSKHRSRALLWASLFPALGSLILPILAWVVIPQTWSWTFFDGAFVYNSWRIFILISGIPALLASATLLYFPESPKFLMSQGRNEEAMKVFQRMYAMNTGNPPESFPIKALSQEGQRAQMQRLASQRSMSIWDKTRSDWSQIKPLFLKPYLYQFLLIITIQMGSILSLNTLRLWMPQLFTLMENFDYENHDASVGNPTLCDMISVPNTPIVTNNTANLTTTDICVPAPIPDRVYINSIIIASTSVIGCTLAGSLVNLIGKKKLLLSIYVAAAACTFGLNWSPDSEVTLAILSIYMALTNISVTTIISFIVDLMPTSLRAMAVSLTMCVGRSGAMLGNLLFPILLSSGCMVPFIFVGGFLLLCFVLAIFIPKPPAKLM